MSKPRPIAFHELRVLRDQSRPLVSMPVPASPSAKPRNWWYREPNVAVTQGSARSGRGAKVTSQVLSALETPSPSAPPYELAPLQEDVGDEDERAMPFAAERVQGQPELLDMAESRRRWQRLSELTPVDPPAPVAAIALSISRASALLDVCALVVELCGGERQHLAGTWEATLPLGQQGLGGTLLWLRLSAESLALRFICDEQRTMDLVRPRIDELRRRLLEQLAPPLELSIDLEMR